MTTPPDRPLVSADRLVFFTDAVVAIAMTLLVLPLVELVPAALAGAQPAAEVVTDHLEDFWSFALSFVVIARLWAVHHVLLDGAQRASGVLVNLALAWVLTIVVMPFPTALIALPGDDPFVPRLYFGVLAANLVVLSAMAWVLRRDRALAPEPPAARLVSGITVTAGLLVVVFVVALIAPDPQFTWLLVLLVPALFDRVADRVRERRRTPPTAA